MTRFLILSLLAALLGGCVVVPAGYVSYDNGYRRGYYRDYSYQPRYYAYNYDYSYRGYYRDHGQ
jgi:hypothetical protein